MVQQTKFNMSAATLERLDEWLRKAMATFYNGDIARYFYCLKNVNNNAMFKFQPKERKMLKEIEGVFVIERNEDRRCRIANLYNEKLQDLMNKYGLLLPDRVDDLDTAY